MIQAVAFKDFYKADHISQYPEGTTLVYSNLTARKSRTGFERIVFFGLQAFIQDFLIREYSMTFFYMEKETAVSRYKRRLDNALGKGAVSVKHIQDLWDLQYLPIEIKALEEGTLCPTGVPFLTIKNTRPEFFWLVNDLETVLSCELWLPITSATTAFRFRLLLETWAEKTGGSKDFVMWQAHDFSMRGMAGRHAAMSSGAAHLLSFYGTDTMPAIDWLEEYYGADSDNEVIGGSVFATEHSVMCMGTKDDEIGTFERLLFYIYPQAPVLSVVSDTWSLSKVCTEYLPKLRDRILQRPGKLVIRPDSGDPVKILCGYSDDELIRVEGSRPGIWLDVEEDEEGNVRALSNYSKKISPFYRKGLIETLWDIFGGTINEGYKQLDPHIGAIYGDSITLERADRICQELKAKGFSSTNVVFGVGSYTYQYTTRDTYGMAMKATYGEVVSIAEYDMFDQGGPSLGERWIECREIWKAPETDDGTKFSAKGLLQVTQGEYGLVLKQQCTWEEEQQGLLKTVFLDGRITKFQTLKQIRERIWKQLS